MINVSIGHVRDIETGNLTKILVNAIIGVGKNDSTLKDILNHGVGEWMRRGSRIGFEQPRMLGTGLEQ